MAISYILSLHGFSFCLVYSLFLNKTVAAGIMDSLNAESKREEQLNTSYGFLRSWLKHGLELNATHGGTDIVSDLYSPFDAAIMCGDFNFSDDCPDGENSVCSISRNDVLFFGMDG